MDQVLVNRMIRVLYLLADNLNHTVEEIAEKVEACPRTVYRYLNTFKSAGLKVICRYGSVYKIDRESLSWGDNEQAAKNSEGNELEHGIVLQTPGQNLKSPDGTYEVLEQFNEKGILKEMPYLQKSVANIDLLVKAAGQHRKVQLRNYASNESNRYCDHIIEPYDFPFYYNFVWAYDCILKRNVLLRSTRMDEVQLLDEYWDNEEQHRRQYMDAWGCYGHLAHPITLRLTMKARNLMIEAYPMTMLEMVPEKASKDGKHWILKTMVCNYHGVGQFIMGLMKEVEILHGDGLKRHLKKRCLELQRIVESY